MLELLTISAILLGPVLAILISRHLDVGREERSRKMDIFRTLMRTRRTPMWGDHVGALNLVEIEFKNVPTAISAWKNLLEHFAANHARNVSEEVSDKMGTDESGTRTRRFHERLALERQKLLAKLLHALAKNLNFDAEQLEIFEGGYTPQGWSDLEQEQSIIRRFALDLYTGKCVVPVGVVDYTSAAQQDNIEH